MVPAEKQVEDHPGYLFEEGICGVRNDENEGGDQKPVASFSNMYVEVVADISRKQVPGEGGQKIEDFAIFLDFRNFAGMKKSRFCGFPGFSSCVWG